MGQVLIRNLDEDVIARLKNKASGKNLSLEQYLRDTLTESVRPTKDELIAEFDRIRHQAGSVDRDPADLIREDRDNDTLRR